MIIIYYIINITILHIVIVKTKKSLVMIIRTFIYIILYALWIPTIYVEIRFYIQKIFVKKKKEKNHRRIHIKYNNYNI